MEGKYDFNKTLVEILIVEDSLTQAMMLKYILEREGYVVRTANNGQEALISISRARPTIIISDILMPEMDGYQLCKRLKSDPNLKDIPVMLLTAPLRYQRCLERLRMRG